MTSLASGSKQPRAGDEARSALFFAPDPVDKSSVYLTLFAVLACVSFYAKGADLEGRSRAVWVGLSLVSWIAFTHWFVGGIIGGILSQVLLFLAMYGWTELREWLATRRKA